MLAKHRINHTTSKRSLSVFSETKIRLIVAVPVSFYSLGLYTRRLNLPDCYRSGSNEEKEDSVEHFLYHGLAIAVIIMRYLDIAWTIRYSRKRFESF